MKLLLPAATGFFIAVLLFSSCKKDDFITSGDARLNITADSLRFDTVFTTVGSVTQSFKIINENDQKIKLTQIKLAGGAASPFKMNVNGAPVNELNNVEIKNNDSIYVFVTVTVNPTTANLPFILSDSIAVTYNGRTRFVHLEAFGQNAIFIRSGLITGSVTFTNTQPYVILGGLQVGSAGSLTLNAGTRIFCHADAPILVDGTMISNGTKSAPVTFAGDRTDDPYRNFPAAWPGIYFRSASKNNVLKFTNVKNAYQAIVALQPSVNANPKVSLSQCIIDNAYDAGLLASNSAVSVDNTLISNCGKNIAIDYGGTYSFVHCTVAGYSNSFVLHTNPGVTISNANSANAVNPLTSLFRNCIIYGDGGLNSNEFQITRQGSSSFNVTVDHCLYRAASDPVNVTFISSLKNIDPSFDSIDITHRIYDFRTTKNPTAAGVNKGISTLFIKDLDDLNRNNGLPDLGAYEKQ